MATAEQLLQPVEMRVDPEDEIAYTFENCMDWYKGYKTPAEVKEYWDKECIPTGHPQLPGSIPVWHDGKPLPGWAFNSANAADIDVREEEKRKNPKKTFFALGAIEAAMVTTWKYVFVSVFLLWTPWAVIPWISYVLAECSGPGIAHVPAWLLFAFIPIQLMSIALEIKGFTLLAPALARHVPLGTILGIPVSFGMWFLFRISLSAGAHMDLATNGIFVGRLLRTAECSDSGIPHIQPLLWMGLLVWFAMFAQLVVSLMYSLPYRTKVAQEKESSFQFASIGTLLRFRAPQANVRMSTVMGVLNPSDAVLSLAQVGRMALLGSCPASINNASRGPRLSKSAETRKNWALVLQKDALMMAFVLLMENTSMVILQAWGLGAVKRAGGGVDMLTFVSIFFTLTSVWFNFTFGAMTSHERQKAFWPHLNKHLNRVHKNPKLLEEHQQFDSNGKRAVKRALCLLAFAGLACVPLSLYGGFTVVMDALICGKHAIWALGAGGCTHAAV
eukprot:TRINITY_DN14283_c0_g1_i1.p1 TRINITY_DN14283_c0_g1~~TRINITY_DN14283_c0_g1_i1.p1  ORF type:complete len:522 (-),score=65.31 TRINITY_DN14283_c0_g1_i1:164-1669(-)